MRAHAAKADNRRVEVAYFGSTTVCHGDEKNSAIATFNNLPCETLNLIAMTSTPKQSAPLISNRQAVNH
jgi:hypothetical protein